MRTDMTKLTADFRNFANKHKNFYWLGHVYTYAKNLHPAGRIFVKFYTRDSYQTPTKLKFAKL